MPCIAGNHGIGFSNGSSFIASALEGLIGDFCPELALGGCIGSLGMSLSVTWRPRHCKLLLISVIAIATLPEQRAFWRHSLDQRLAAPVRIPHCSQQPIAQRSVSAVICVRDSASPSADIACQGGHWSLDQIGQCPPWHAIS